MERVNDDMMFYVVVTCALRDMSGICGGGVAVGVGVGVGVGVLVHGVDGGLVLPHGRPPLLLDSVHTLRVEERGLVLPLLLRLRRLNFRLGSLPRSDHLPSVGCTSTLLASV